MAASVIQLSYNSTTVNLTLVNQDNYGAEYYGETGTKRLTCKVNHTIQPAGVPGESHLLRLNIEEYDAEGVYLRTSSAWSVVRTDGGVQDSAEAQLALAGLQELLGETGIIAGLVGRQSVFDVTQV